MMIAQHKMEDRRCKTKRDGDEEEGDEDEDEERRI